MLFKRVNGERVQCSDQEEAEIRARWAKADQEHELKQEQMINKRSQKTAILNRLGLTAEEYDLLMDKSI
ncbi:MAG: hypothetical protein GWN00_20365 [Aliifodinibius sp.]|nr:hypothetical protein [candidate division Zixibacteria bacterium]NIT58493.1 hypothetical protein [Fodinibius sp.]NIR65175.1 hypothetical protein [candidate division Zixibacteria bacterium]NIS46907.1 hypothetical protein [candidate division Zixibacteria bacterium]NIU15051.1 hypothetical protein [candidate division Zixibacteria bacterium]